MWLVYLGIFWFLGIWSASLFAVDLPYWLAAAGLCLLGAGLAHRQRPFLLVLVCLAAFALGGARYTTAVPIIDSTHVAFYNDSDDITLVGLVVDEPDVRDRFTLLRLQVEDMTLSGGPTFPVSGIVQVKTYRYPEMTYGMRLRVNGRLETPPEDEEFSYRDYLARQGVHSIMELPYTRVLAEGEGSPLYHTLFAFKQRAQDTIIQLFPAPQSALLTGILLGNDNNIPPDLADDFRSTGMTHIIAISGFNIAILIAIMMSLMSAWMPRRLAIFVSISGVVLYTLLVGADASVVRAALMGSIYLIAVRWLGRPNFAFGSLFLAGIVMTVLRPFTLWDVGFQLSFTATLGLMLYADPFTQWTRRQLCRVASQEIVERVMSVITEAVIITLAAQVLTLPLMLGYFQQLSLVSLPANAFILPAQPGVMLWGGLATLVGMAAPAVGQLLAWIAWLFLTYTIWLVRLFASVPGAAVPLTISWNAVLLIYAIILIITFINRQSAESKQTMIQFLKRNLSQRLALGFTCLAALLTISWAASQPDNQLHIAFLNVGQGDATFIQTPSGHQILIDGGFYPSVLDDQLGRQMPFWDKRIDLVIATHPDADHVSGLVNVFEHYQVDQLLTDGEGMGESVIYDAVLTAAADNGATIRPALAGEVIDLGDGVMLEVLHPGSELDLENRNENSVSMRLVYKDFTYLFTGDAEQMAEKEMLANGRSLQATVFKAGHHGSNSSSSAAFLAAVQPHMIIISSGIDNRFGHPHPDMLQRATAIGAAVLRTDQLGTIRLTTDGQTMWWQSLP